MHRTFFLPRHSIPNTAPILGFITAGVPMEPAPFERQQRLPVPRQYRRCGMFAFWVDGDSMTLEDGSGIPHGSYVLVDTHDILSREGYVFAFRLPDGAYVSKRLRLFQGRPSMRSDNLRYPPVLLHSEIIRIGRVYAYSLDGVTFHDVGYRAAHIN